MSHATFLHLALVLSSGIFELNHLPIIRSRRFRHFAKWVFFLLFSKMKVSVVSRSGKEVVKGGVELSDSVRSFVSLTIVFRLVFVIPN